MNRRVRRGAGTATWLLLLALACGRNDERAAPGEPAPPAKPASLVAAAKASAVAPSGGAAVPAAFACGGKDQPMCPMQAWMKLTMAPASGSEDGPALAKAFDYVAARPPPGFDRWVSIASEGGKKARSGDVDSARDACKGCHDLYKARYKTEMRDRSF